MSKITMWGFGGSTFVRTIRMVLAEKGVTDYEETTVNLMEGAQKSAEHHARHPFGRVPVVEVDGFRVIETPAIARYLDAVLPGPKLVPGDPKDAARMDMVVGIMNSYAYDAMVFRVAGYHLFPDFTGGKDEARHRQGIADSHVVLDTVMRIKGDSPFLAGDALSVADLYLAPILDYVVMTPCKQEFLARPDVGAWWDAISARDSFKATPFGM